MSVPRPIFEIYVDDDRYTVPTLHLMAAADEVDARRIVERIMQENAHHLGAELRCDGCLLVVVGSFAERARAAPDAPLPPADGTRPIHG